MAQRPGRPPRHGGGRRPAPRGHVRLDRRHRRCAPRRGPGADGRRSRPLALPHPPPDQGNPVVNRIEQVAVLGAGSWGTTIASIAATNAAATIWARDPDQAAEIDGRHTNTRYLGERPLSPALRATDDLVRAVDGAEVVAFGIPSRSLREAARAAAPHLRPGIPVVSLAKGLERGTHLRPSQILEQELPGHPVAVLSGPNLA
ncbi:MAG: hypothetical protein F2817_17100, partial [Actinobacteria bacterium]|nr:hypothetical protein [Actinomycetota bacterium]